MKKKKTVKKISNSKVKRIKTTKKAIKKEDLVKNIKTKEKKLTVRSPKNVCNEHLDGCPIGSHQVIQDKIYWRDRGLEYNRNDWGGEPTSWVEGYWESRNHPHRDQLVEELRKLEPQSILEIGCAVGANLALIRQKINIPDYNLAGLDINEEAIKFAQEKLPGILYRVGDAKELPFESFGYDLVLADAVLMYSDDKDAKLVLDEMNRVAKRFIMIVDWEGEGLQDYHWTRDYTKLLEKRGFDVSKVKINWPTSEAWKKHGQLFIARRLS